MTIDEAIELENKCDELMSKAIGEECSVSMAMIGRLKVNFGENYFSLDKNFKDASYIKYHGFYSDLLSHIANACMCVADNKELFDKLVWSYNNRSDLEK